MRKHSARKTPQKNAKKQIVGSIGIILRGRCVLISRRRKNDVLGGFWEFPGGKRRDGESDEDCLHREIREELGITINISQALAAIEYDYPDALVKLFPFICRSTGGRAKPFASQQIKWVNAGQLRRHRFPPANDDLLAQVVALLKSR